MPETPTSTNGAAPADTFGKTGPSAAALRQISSTGLKRLGGRIYEEFLPELRFPQGLRIYEEMRKNSGVIGGFLRAVNSSFRSVEWYTVPADDSPEAIKHAAFVDSCRNDIRPNWNNFLTDALTFLPFGFSGCEMVFKVRNGHPHSKFDDGKIGFKKISLIGHDTIQRWEWGADKELAGIVQVSPPSYENIIIPRSKFLLFRTAAEKDNPEGASLLREGYYSYYNMTRIEAIEAISLERTGAGVPTVTMPQGATRKADGPNSDEEAAEELVRTVRVDEQGGVVLPFGWVFELARPNGRVDAELFDLAVKRHRSALLMSVLAVFLELGTARVGSFALAEQGQGFFETAFEGYVLAFEETFNEEAIPLLMELNGFPTENPPKLTHATIAGTNIEAISRSLRNFVEVGYLDPNDPLVQNYLKGLLRLPRGDTVREIEDMTAQNEPRKDSNDEARTAPQPAAGQTGAPPEQDQNRTPSADAGVGRRGRGRPVNAAGSTAGS